MVTTTTTPVRIPLSRSRISQAAVAFADREGIESLSMRKLGQELGVKAMSLYNHVTNKEDLLNGMVDTVLEEIDMTPGGSNWQSAMRRRILAARKAFVAHPWASQVIETRTSMSHAVIAYHDGIIGIFRDGGFTMNQVHHALHTLGSRIFGISQELFDTGDKRAESPEMAAIVAQEMTDKYPHLSVMVNELYFYVDGSDIARTGCDTQTEFEIGLDVLLDGLERLRLAGTE